MQVQIKFTTYGGNPLVGEFSPGDTARVSASLARHLVETKVARYMQRGAEQATAVQDAVQDQPAPKGAMKQKGKRNGSI